MGSDREFWYFCQILGKKVHPTLVDSATNSGSALQDDNLAPLEGRIFCQEKFLLVAVGFGCFIFMEKHVE